MATILLTRPNGMWTGRIVGPRELSDGMGVDRNLGGFVTGWGSDGRNTGSDIWMHTDAWDGWPWQARTREGRKTHVQWQASAGECGLSS